MLEAGATGFTAVAMLVLIGESLAGVRGAATWHEVNVRCALVSAVSFVLLAVIGAWWPALVWLVTASLWTYAAIRYP